MGKEPGVLKKGLIFKLILDVLMTAFLLIAFAYHLTGNLTHEVVGVILFVLFVAHNAVNWKWYKSLFKGKYHIRRTLGTVINFLLAVSMVVLAISGMMISRDVFAFMGLGGGFQARQLHIFSAYWGLLLISVHAGLHWNMILGAIRKMTGLTSTNRIYSVLFFLLAMAIAAYGVKSSFDMDVGSKLFLQYAFGFWDFENAAAEFFLAHLSIMGLYIFITHYALLLLKKHNDNVNIPISKT
jgi:hypothetical protein